MSLGRLFFSFYWFEDYKAIKLIRRLFSSSAILIWELKKASPSNSCQQKKTLTVFFHTVISCTVNEKSPCPKYSKNSDSILPCFNITENERKPLPKILRKDLAASSEEEERIPGGDWLRRSGRIECQSPSDCRRGRREGETVLQNQELRLEMLGFWGGGISQKICD